MKEKTMWETKRDKYCKLTFKVCKRVEEFLKRSIKVFNKFANIRTQMYSDSNGHD